MNNNNNKYRNNNNNNNNNNNQIFSLNYKFDSNSIAGKCSGTALDLIKKYNELAKEAHSGNNYVEMEVFRQYAEHYRKIVTDINEKKAQNPNPNQNQNPNHRSQNFRRNNDENANNSSPEVGTSISNDNADVVQSVNIANEVVSVLTEEKIVAPAKREFKIVEVSAATVDAENVEKVEAQPKAKRVYRKKVAAAAV